MTPTHPVRGRIAVALLTPLLLLAAGCGAGPNSDLVVQPQPNQDVVKVDPVSDPVHVGLTEWTIVTSVKEVHPGEVTLLVTNTGGTEHDLNVKGRAGEWATHTLKPGEQAELKITAEKAEVLELWCSEPGHEAQGMHTTLKVLP